MASAFLTSLGTIANQYGEAKNSAREEQQARADKLRAMDVQDAYLQLARQADERQKAITDQNLKIGRYMKLGNNMLWDVETQKPVTIQPTEPLEHFKKLISSLPKDVAEGASGRVQSILEAEPGDYKSALAEGMRYIDAQKAEANRREDAQKTEENRRADAKTREEERRQDKREAEAANERLQKMMVDFRLAERQKYMTPQERQTYDAIKTAEPMVDRLAKFIEDNKLQDENSFVMGSHSALAQHLRFMGYKGGVEPEKVSSQLIKDAAALQVMGARPWMTMGRGKYMFETISQHLPAPTDTPGQLYSKVTWLRDNVLSDAREALSGYVQPGEVGGANDPLGVLPGVKP